MNFLTQEIRQQIKNQLEPLTDSNINDIETAEGRICAKKMLPDEGAVFFLKQVYKRTDRYVRKDRA